jgi:energy-coupling factor transport system permease protein
MSTVAPDPVRAARGVNPVTKLAAVLVIALPLVVTIDPVSAAVALVLEVPLFLTAGLAPRAFWTRTAPVWVAAPLVALTIALYGQASGAVLFEWWAVRVSEGSLLLALATGLRILAIGLPAVVLFATVDATALADGLAQLVRLPARFVLGALAGRRLVELLGDDWRALALARRARGVADRGRVRRVLGMAFALLVLSVRRGSALATAMEARGFGGGTPRTWARPSRFRRADALLLSYAVLIPVAALSAAALTGAWHPVFSPA